MRAGAMAVVVGVVAWVASTGCVSTAPFDAAHLARSHAINARYDAALAHVQAHAAGQPAAPDNVGPIDATPGAGLDRGTPPGTASPHTTLERERQRELDASRRLRDADIARARAARRHRVQAAAALASPDHISVRRAPSTPGTR